nr:transposase [Prochloraceae cyanobacterium]
MLLTFTNRLKLNRAENDALRAMCRLSKNLFNVGLYNVRQYFFNEKKFLRYEGSYHYAKSNENYTLLPTDIGQQTLKVVDRAFRGFFNLIKLKKTGQYDAKVRLPGYLPKDGFFPLIIPIRERDLLRLKDKNWQYKIPMSRPFKRSFGRITLTIPEKIRDKIVKEISILPKYKARVFDIAYVYEAGEEEKLVNGTDTIGIDLGVNNLATCVSTKGDSFIIDGKRLKNLNQWYNKRNAKLQSIKDIQGIEDITFQQALLLDRRKHQIQDYLNKSVRFIIDRCLNTGINKIVVGYNPGIKLNANMGTRNNQNFVQIPLSTLRSKLQSLCEPVGIEYIETEESYTSKASAIDGDEIPKYNLNDPQKYTFSGKRIKRGLYRTKTGQLINADANASLNILRKHLGLSKANDLKMIRRISGCLTHPKRIRSF